MLAKRDRMERGHVNFGWLDGRHSFSFGQYYDPDHMGFSALRVINEDHILGGAGFPMHPHDNMEIITYVLKGEISHKDSMGNGSTIRPGEIQVMSAGTGVRHSEFNSSETDTAHLLQIWLLPNVRNAKPNYQQKRFDDADMQGKFRMVVTPDGRQDSLTMNQDAILYAGRFKEGESAQINLEQGRKGWVQLARGAVSVNGQALKEGDGLAIQDEDLVAFTFTAPSEVLFFDLP